jgi:hypothetical protein
MHRISQNYFFDILILVLALPWQSFSLEPRKAFAVPLPYLNASVDPAGNVREVVINFGKSDEKWSVSVRDEIHYKFNDRDWYEHTYLEPRGEEFIISPTEGMLLAKVCDGFSQTLDIFERDLRKGDWDRLRYLDGSMAAFLKDFYWLYGAARANTRLMPPRCRIADSLADGTFSSPVTDRRVATWKASPDHIIKLRIAAKELMLRIREWTDKDLTNKKRDPLEDYSKKFREIYALFVKLYFNLALQ